MVSGRILNSLSLNINFSKFPGFHPVKLIPFVAYDENFWKKNDGCKSTVLQKKLYSYLSVLPAFWKINSSFLMVSGRILNSLSLNINFSKFPGFHPVKLIPFVAYDENFWKKNDGCKSTVLQKSCIRT